MGGDDADRRAVLVEAAGGGRVQGGDALVGERVAQRRGDQWMAQPDARFRMRYVFGIHGMPQT